VLDPDTLHPSATLIDILERRAAEDGDRLAYTFVVDGEREEISLTFAELERRTRALAARLQALGRIGDRVLVLCPAGLEYVVAALASLYGGFVTVPTYAPEVGRHAAQLTDVMRDSGAQIGVTTYELLPQLLEVPELSRVQWVTVDRENPPWDDGPTGSPLPSADPWTRPPVDPDSLALVLYTSGSTSRPKGVMFSHRNLLDPARTISSLISDPRDERMVVATAPHVSDSVRTGIAYPLYRCIPVISIAPEALSERPARWLETISRVRGTTSFAANFLFDLSVRSIPPEARAALDLSCVRYLRNSGEAVRADTVARFEEYFAPCGLRPGAIRSAYGLSEAPGVAQSLPGHPITLGTFDRARLENGEAVVVPPEAGVAGRTLVGQGPPTTGQRLEIVDPHALTRCAPGRVGEIWTSGPHVARGYLNRPEETQAAFGARLADTGEGPFFRTGDMGFLHEGELFIAGRLKEIIIIRGRNLYPVDLEASLQDCHPALAGHAAAAFAIEVDGEERLAIVHEVDAPLTPSPSPMLGEGSDSGPGGGGLSDIISAIRQTVFAQHGVQAHTVFLVPPDIIPRLGVGKLGRTECRSRLLSGTLPVLRQDVLDPASLHGRVPPRTPTERTLAGIWEQVLEVEGVGIHDAFADLGGDSLLSMQILLGIKEAGLPVTTEDIYRHRTIAALAAAIDVRRTTVSTNGRPLVGSIPLTSNQLWLLEGDTPWAVGEVVLTQRASEVGALDTVVLERAAQQLVFHHDALRLRCVHTVDGWRAEYVGHTPPGLVSVCDLSDLPAGEQQTHVPGEIRRVRESIDVRGGPLVRLGLLRLGDARDLVVLCLHHLISDLLSTQILIRDLDTLYSQLARGLPPELPARTATITDWLKRSASFARSDTARQDVAYWTRVVAHQPSKIPPDFPKGSRRPGREQVVAVWLGREQTRELKNLRRLSLSLSDAIHYALARALSEATRSSTVLFMTLSHSRGPLFADLDLSRTVGFLASPFLVLLDVGGEAAAGHVEGARAVRAQMEAIPHHGMGYGILLNHGSAAVRTQLTGPGNSSRIQLNYWGETERPYSGLSIFRPAAKRETTSSQTAGEAQLVPWHSRIEVTASIVRGDLLLWMPYHERAYHAATIEALADRMIAILRELSQAVTNSRVPSLHA
jgi:non-ribosomal peptide synthase protein (TIGR01720 family)